MKYNIIISLCLISTTAQALEVRGTTEIEYRYFFEPPLVPTQHNSYTSAVINPEFYHDWDDNHQSLTFAPFYRWDQHDSNRSHADLREFYWLYVGERFEMSAGIRKIFWGTVESQHLVDVINQTDLVEYPDGEDKLGQPMIASTILSDWGDVELYLLPYFRERTFPGEEGRLRTIPRVDTNEPALYEDSKREKHIDIALRWSKMLSGWDIGLSYFNGTNREPRLVPALNSANEPILLPYYELMYQFGIDIQGVNDAWLWKLEAIKRDTHEIDFFAYTVGIEYTFYNINESRVNFGVVSEYLYDDRGSNASTPFNDDVMLGARLTPNDEHGTEFLLSVIIDRQSYARIYSLETSRRLTNHLKLKVEGILFSNFSVNDPFYYLRQDDFIQIGLIYFF